MKKISHIKSIKYVSYTKKNLVLMMISKLHLIKSIKKEEIIVITKGNLEVLLMIFAISDTKHQKKFL